MNTKYRIVKFWHYYGADWFYEIESSDNDGKTWGKSRDNKAYDLPAHAKVGVLKLKEDDINHDIRTVIWTE